MAIHTNTCKKSEKKKGEPKKSFSDEKNLQQGILSNKEVNAHKEVYTQKEEFKKCREPLQHPIGRAHYRT